MIIKVQIIVSRDGGETEVVEEVARLEREQLRPEELGLKLEEAKVILSGIQRKMVEKQAAGFIAERARCPECGKALRHNGRHGRRHARTTSGKLKIESPRLNCCGCKERKAEFQPVSRSFARANHGRAALSGDEMGFTCVLRDDALNVGGSTARRPGP